MVKKNLRIYGAAPGVDRALIGNFNAAWEELQKLSNAGGFYNSKGKLYTKQKDNVKKINDVNRAYRDLLRHVRDIHKQSRDIVNSKLGNDEFITGSDFWKEWDEATKFGQLSDSEIEEANFFRGDDVKHGTRLDEIKNIAEGIAATERKFANRNPDVYWNWFSKKSGLSTQPEAIATEEAEEVKEDKADRHTLSKTNIDKYFENFADDYGEKYLKGLKKEDEDWFNKLAEDYIATYDKKEKKLEDFDEDRQKELAYFHKRWQDPEGTKNIQYEDVSSTTKENNPINTPLVEEPKSGENRDAEHTTAEKPADDKMTEDKIQLGGETVSVSKMDDKKAVVETKPSSVEGGEVKYSGDKPNLEITNKQTAHAYLKPSIRLVQGEDGSIYPQKLKPAERVVYEVDYNNVKEEGNPFKKPSFAGRRNPNLYYDKRFENNIGRNTTKNWSSPKSNPTEPWLPEGFSRSQEALDSYTQAVKVPQYTQPTNIHDMLSFDYAITTNAEYMRSRIQEANNKMFPRKDLSDVKKMRKLRIDNNKNVALKGGMPMSAYF